MEPRLAVLKAVLDVFGVPAEIGTLSDRKRVQKAIYLAQRTGVDLGYRFGWYLMGTYSPPLTRDYFALDEAIGSATEGEATTATLPQAVMEKLQAIRPLFDVPGGVNLRQPDWLEIVASVHYLRRVRELSEEKALEILSEEKHHLVAYIPQAEQALRACGLL